MCEAIYNWEKVCFHFSATLRTSLELTTEATSSPEPITERMSNTTAMPAVLWTAWMNSSARAEMKRGAVQIKMHVSCWIHASVWLLLTVREDACVAAQEVARRVLLSLQHFLESGLRSLKNQHGGFHRSQAGLHQLGLSDVAPCKTTEKPAGGNRQMQMKLNCFFVLFFLRQNHFIKYPQIVLT